MMPEREVPLRNLDSDYDSIDGVEPFEKIGDVSIQNLYLNQLLQNYTAFEDHSASGYNKNFNKSNIGFAEIPNEGFHLRADDTINGDKFIDLSMDNSLIAPNQEEELHKLFGTELIELFNKYDFFE